MGRKRMRALQAALVVVLVVVIATGGTLVAVTAAAQPQLSGTVAMPGLGADVQVTRDVNGITQIAASSTHDLFVAQGFVHASERLWQMEVWRRAGAGRLAEILGSAALPQDEFIRTLNWRGAAEKDYAATSDEGKVVLQAYSDGVNAYIDGHANPLGLAFEVVAAKAGVGDLLHGFRPDPWTPVDTLTFAKVQAWGLGGNMDSEIFRMLVDQRLGDPALTDELFPAYPAGNPVIASPAQTGAAPTSSTSSASTASTASRVTAAATSAASSVSSLAAAAGSSPWASLARVAGGIGASTGLTPQQDMVSTGGVGSNNWVVDGTYTASGEPILSNDPHLGFNMPSVWYVNGLHCRPVTAGCPYDVTGVTFPGTPGVIAGHNARIAWGVTNVNPDVQDLVMEQVDPADPAKYVTATGTVPFTLRTEVVKVAGEANVTLTIRETAHGPIINDADARLKGDPTLLALRWTATAKVDGVLEAFLAIDRASTFKEFRDALRSFGAPSQNFIYADIDGNIGYQAPGAIPVRSDPADLGLRPVPGWDGKHEWTSYVPFDSLPSVYDPPSGRLVTANNQVDGGSAFIGAEYDRGDRAARITQLLDAAKGRVTAATMASIQGDTTLLRAARLIAGMRDLRPKPATADGRTVLDLMLAWDGACTTDSTGCSAYLVFEMALERAIFDDDLGPQARDYVSSDFAPDLTAALVSTATGRASAWWGNRRAGTGADASAVTAMALDTAGAWLRRDLGAPTGWTWGRIHTVAFKEATFGDSGIGPLEWYFDTAPVAVNGAAGAVDNTYYRIGRAYPDPTDPSVPVANTLGEVFSVTNGPSMRAIYDMGDLDASRIITTTGQSGLPFSSHASDWVTKWLNNETVPLPWTDTAIARSVAATLILTPAR